jgi:hypothetical protein
MAKREASIDAKAAVPPADLQDDERAFTSLAPEPSDLDVVVREEGRQ